MAEKTSSTLSQEHTDYLLKRHGTLELDPLPSADPNDPYNWSWKKKHIVLAMVSFHAMMTLVQVAAIIPAYGVLAEDLGTSIQGASYLTSSQILILGIAPLLWKPVSDRFGRRPVEIVSTFGSGAFNIGCALSGSYGAMMVFRCLSAFFIAPPIATGPAVVVEMFQVRERGQKTGIWTLMLTLGPPVGPFIFGFVAEHAGWPWIYWTLAIINFVQCGAYALLGAETARRSTVTLGSIVRPLAVGRYATVIVPAAAYAIILSFASILIEVEIPQIFVPKFKFGPQELGLNFLAILIGTVIGELLGGWLSDLLVNTRAKKLGRRPPPEYRLWLAYPGFVASMVGIVVFGVQVQNASSWNLTPMIGAAIAAGGDQIVTTVLYTYAVDCNTELGGSIGSFFALLRQTWGFIGPFWYPQMFEALGYARSFGLCAGLVAAFSMVPIIVLHVSRRKLAV